MADAAFTSASLPAGLGRRYLLDFDPSGLAEHRTDVLVVGSGIAGLTAALWASRDHEVILVTKDRLDEANTWYAQGGIAGAVGEADSIELHLADTLVVGAGLCDEAAVRIVVGEAPEALESLLGFGVRFDLAENGGVALAREGGHSLPRVLHSGDKTGAAIQSALSRSLVARGRIPALERRFLVDLVTEGGRCTGALVLDIDHSRLELVRADAVVLATGGAGQAYRVTTNPLVATGDGVAAAWRAGADLADLEFVQFHPTALDHESAPRFLVSEALRGDGALLRDCNGERFMVGVHPLAELAPRDVVSREIEKVIARCGGTSVSLDARHLGEAHLRERFPTIWAACAKAGYDLSRDLVPVAPAAHYMVGGVRIDLDGRTSVPGLYASGEVSCSGLHGANRLASNSLLEGLVFSRRIARVLGEDVARAAASRPLPAEKPATGPATAPAPDSARSCAEVIPRLHDTMQEDVGMTRTDEGLQRAAEVLGELSGCVEQSCASDRRSLEAANLVTVASLIAHSARMRTETRGCHSRLDFPERDDSHWRRRIVLRQGQPDRFEWLEGAQGAPARP